MTSDIPPAVAPAAKFEERWNAWIAKAASHDARLRRRWLIAMPMLCLVVAILILFLGGRP